MYLYRIDGLKALYEQRIEDKVLRAKRKTGYEESFSHKQIKKAHDMAPKGNAVFRYSFWMTQQLAMTYSNRGGMLVQRINNNHPALESFERDQDEYLPDEAYLYWSIMPVNPDNPYWSPVGISHKDIEVLLLDGSSWVPMNEVALFREREPGWDSYWIEDGIEIQSKQISHSDGNWVLLRQRSECLPPMNNQFAYTHLFKAIFNKLPYKPDSYRWFWARETSWGVLVRELSVTFIPSSNILQSIVDSFLGRNYEWRPKVAEKKCLSMGTIETLYDRFGISDLLLREKSWKYK